MSKGNWDWVDQQEERIADERGKDYFNIVEGKQQFVLLTHFAPLAQVWDGKKYRVAEEGDKNVSMKGVCWVMQDGVLKQAKMPYTVVKQIRALGDDPEWDFDIPFTHPLTLSAKGAGTKEVEYNTNASPKTVEIPASILAELAEKPTPEEIVEKIKGGGVSPSKSRGFEYPEEEINPEDIPFGD